MKATLRHLDVMPPNVNARQTAYTSSCLTLPQGPNKPLHACHDLSAMLLRSSVSISELSDLEMRKAEQGSEHKSPGKSECMCCHVETNDGAILFVFGDEAAVAAAQQKEEADKPMQEAAVVPEEPVVEPEAVNSAPSPEEAAAEPEAAYEAVRAKQVVEAAAGAVTLHGGVCLS